MIFDGFVCIVLVLAFYKGWKKGVLWAVCSLIATIIAVMLAMKMSHILANFLFHQHIVTSSYTVLISFIVIFISVMLLARFIISNVEKLLKSIMLGWVNQLAGGVLYTFITICVISVVLWFANNIQLTGSKFKSDSKTYPYIEPIARYTANAVTTYWPSIKQMMQDLSKWTK